MADKSIGLVEVALETTELQVRPPRGGGDLQSYVKFLRINAIQLNPDFLADTIKLT